MSDDVPSVAKLPTKWGQFDIHVYHEEETGLDHVALMLGSMEGPDPVLMRVIPSVSPEMPFHRCVVTGSTT